MLILENRVNIFLRGLRFNDFFNNIRNPVSYVRLEVTDFSTDREKRVDYNYTSRSASIGPTTPAAML